MFCKSGPRVPRLQGPSSTETYYFKISFLAQFSPTRDISLLSLVKGNFWWGYIPTRECIVHCLPARRLVTPRGGEWVRPPCTLGRHIRQRRQTNSAQCTHAYVCILSKVPLRVGIWTPSNTYGSLDSQEPSSKTSHRHPSTSNTFLQSCW